MPTKVEYALMSAAVYRSSAENLVYLPNWSIELQVPQSGNNFGANAYKNGNEIVIAFRGTDEMIADFAYANIPAGLGLPSSQVEDALAFYVQVRQQNPNANITFTGHSLGAGLASLLAVYFDRPATVFDNAPFGLSATVQFPLSHYSGYLNGLGYAEPVFTEYVNNFANLYYGRAQNVVSYRTDGEVLSRNLPALGRITSEPERVFYNRGGISSIELHSMMLLASTTGSDNLAHALEKNDYFLPLAFDESLLYRGPQANETDFLTYLVQSLSSAGPGLLEALASDLKRLEERNGQTAQFTRALTLAAMEAAYGTEFNDAEPIFQDAESALSFEVGRIGGGQQSVAMLIGALQGVVSPEELALLPSLAGFDSWYIQHGSNGMQTTASAGASAVMIGGTGADVAAGADGDDVLWGNDGDDQLGGGEGQDTLLGGTGKDSLDGGGGKDTLFGGTGNDDLNGGAGHDLLRGGAGEDILAGGEGNDTMKGEADSDLLLGFDGTDELDGGAGDDHLDGGADGDTLQGDAGDDTLDGGAGADKLYGGAGDDVLDGADGAGGDVLSGGIGYDIYRVDSGDTIIDEDGQGEIWLAGKRLTMATRKKGETVYHDDAGNTYLLQGNQLSINDPLVIANFSNGQFGIVLQEEDEDPDDPHDPDAKDKFKQAIVTSSPIVLDLDGGGIATRGIGQGAFFDFDGNGFAERTGWVGTGEGILVRDRNGDGRITDGGELFGDRTKLQDGSLAQDGYQALRALDANGDGAVDVQDVAWSELRIWRDVNSDGISSADELSSLAALGVQRLYVERLAGAGTDARGNDHRYAGTFERTDGSKGGTEDIWFRNNPASTRYENATPVPEDIALLPDLAGMGNVRSLQHTMAADTSGTLRALLDAYSNEHDPAQRRTILVSMVYAWTGVSGLDPSSRGIWIDDARKLYALERLLGEDFLQGGYMRDPYPGAAAVLEASFNDLLSELCPQLDSQTVYKDWLDRVSINWDAEAGELRGSLSAVVDKMALMYQSEPSRLNEELPGFIAALSATRTLSPFDPTSFFAAIAVWSTAVAGQAELWWSKLAGTESADIAILTDQPDAYNALGGDDAVHGAGGNDTLDGGSGNDNLSGDGGDDELTGGTGDDYLVGGEGRDTFIYQRGDGRDTILMGAESGETLRLKGVLPTEVTIARVADNLVLSLSAQDQVTVAGYFAATTNSLQIHFDTGELWDLAAIKAAIPWNAGAGADTFYGYIGADSIAGLGGDDVLEGRQGVDSLYGGDGRDTLRGEGGDDLLEGGKGDDLLIGGDGANTYVIGPDDGHDILEIARYSWATIRFGAGVAKENVSLTNTEAGVAVYLGEGAPALLMRLDQLDPYITFEFSDGSEWTRAEMLNRVGATAGDDKLVATGATLRDLGAGNDRVRADGHNNTLRGGSGNDTLSGSGSGNIYLWDDGDGRDLIEDNAGTLRLGGGILAAETQVRMNSAGYYLLLRGGQRIDIGTDALKQVEFADGVVWSKAELQQRAVVPTAGDDYLGLAGNLHTLAGAGGNDVLIGSAGADTLDGGAGNDSLSGQGGGDIYRYRRGDGDDVITSYGGTGTLALDETLAVTDVVAVRRGNDMVLYFAGGGSITVPTGSAAVYSLNQIRFADGTQWSFADLATRMLAGADYAQSLFADASHPILSGLGGNDTLQGDYAANTLAGGKGDDSLIGLGGSDVYLYELGDGSDIITDGLYYTGNASVSTLRFGIGIAAADLAVTREGTALRIAFRDNPTDGVTLLSGAMRVEFADGSAWTAQQLLDQLFQGTAASEQLFGDNRSNFIAGGAGDDTLSGGYGADTLNGGLGNDLLAGDADGDTYLYARGDGNDEIAEGNSYAGDNVVDVLRFGAGIAASDISASRNSYDLVLAVAPDGALITLRNWFAGSRIERFEFADGTVMESAAITDLALSGTAASDQITGDDGANNIDGRGGNDTLEGGGGADTLTGGLGDDWLDGSGGADVYIYRRGDGRDIIADHDYSGNGGPDELRFGPGILSSEVTAQRRGYDMVLALAGEGEVLTLASWYSPASRIERISFADGTIWLADDLMQVPTVGTQDDDYLYGSDAADTLAGQAGNDVLYGGSGSDVLNGGSGNDLLFGDGGADIYLIEAGDGNDVIDGAGEGEQDVLRFGTGISPANVTLRRDPSNLYFELGGGQSVRVANYSASRSVIARVEFADGTVWTRDDIVLRLQQPTAGNDWIEAGDASATLSGLAGNDKLYGSAGSDSLSGNAGADTLEGNDGNDTLAGGTGNDQLNGGAGDDLYQIEAGGGVDNIRDVSGMDTLSLGNGIAAAGVTVHREGGNTVLVVEGSTQRIRIEERLDGTLGVGLVKFADGQQWDRTALAAKMAAGSSLDDYIRVVGAGQLVSGQGGNDSLVGGEGNDTLAGGAGSDLLEGGGGDDCYRYNLGDGTDYLFIAEGGGNDRLVLGSELNSANISFAALGDSLVMRTGNPADSLFIAGWFAAGAPRNLTIEFADGSTLTAGEITELAQARGTEGDDYLAGSHVSELLEGFGGDDALHGLLGDDTLDGGTGDDTLFGDGGNDVYLFGRGDGKDLIYPQNDTVGQDTVRLKSGIDPADLRVYRIGGDVELRIAGTEDSMRLWNWMDGTNGVARIEFADGTVWLLGDIQARLEFPTSDDSDWLHGTSSDDLIDGKGGDDNLSGDGGNDTLIGGTGDDWLNGEAGDDTYSYAMGDGADRFVFDAETGSDTLMLAAGIDAAAIALRRDLSNLYLQLGDSELVLDGWFGPDGHATGGGQPRILFGDGTVWTTAGTAGRLAVAGEGNDFLLGSDAAQTLQGLAGNDTLLGGAAADLLAGGTGDDSLAGGGGDDTLEGGGGANDLAGGVGNDFYRVAGGSAIIRDWSMAAGEQDSLQLLGVLPSQVAVAARGGDLLLIQVGGSELARIVGYFSDSADGTAKAGTIIFDNGTSWSRSDVLALVPPPGQPTEAGDQLALTGPGVLHGLGGNDDLSGVSNSTLHGDAGNDHLAIPNAGSDSVLHGDDGNDMLEVGSGARNHLFGDEGDDALQGGYLQLSIFDGGGGADYLSIGDGNGNTLRGGGGDDAVMMRHGNDNRLEGGAGNDFLQANGGERDFALGGAGNDSLMGSSGSNSEFYGDEGDDQLQYSGGAGHLLDGGEGNDSLNGFTSSSTLRGGAGDDSLLGSGNGMVLEGGADSDQLMMGSSSASVLDGGDGADTLSIGSGMSVTMLGGGGTDTLSLGSGSSSLLDGGDGDDVIQIGAYEANVARGGNGNDNITVSYGNSLVEGGNGDDVLTAGGANQMVIGGAGNDRLVLQHGNDVIGFNAGDGSDTIEAQAAAHATLSLGGAIQLADLLFSREGSDLVLQVSATDSLRLRDWYSIDSPRHMVDQLQLIFDGGGEYAPTSGDPIRAYRSATFSFSALVDVFDEALEIDNTLTGWSLSSTLLQAHLGSSDEVVFGGELAYQFAHHGTVGGLNMAATSAVLSASSFGNERQNFQPAAS